MPVLFSARETCAVALAPPQDIACIPVHMAFCGQEFMAELASRRAYLMTTSDMDLRVRARSALRLLRRVPRLKSHLVSARVLAVGPWFDRSCAFWKHWGWWRTAAPGHATALAACAVLINWMT